jgi:hypothetical protein
MSDKIKPHHLERKAILYIRQSSAYQVSLCIPKTPFSGFPPEVTLFRLPGQCALSFIFFNIADFKGIRAT